MILSRTFRFLKKVLSGEDAVLIRQSKGEWNRQFRDGRWDRIATSAPNTTRIAELIRGKVQAYQGTLRVLDVGCGNGALARLLVGQERISYFGLDFSEAALVAARTAVPTGTFILADAEHPPKDLGTFDIIVFSEVLYYADPRTVLPLYIEHAAIDAHLFISVVQFIRSPFVWGRIRRTIDIVEREVVTDKKTGTRWDIAQALFHRA